MSHFECPILKIAGTEPIEGADRIELVRVAGFRSVAVKGAFKAGDLAAYIPEGALLPEWLLRTLGLFDDAKGMGKLSGPTGNRVSAARLRGCLSQGLLLRLDIAPGATTLRVPAADGAVKDVPVAEGDDVADLLGCGKYAPEIPAEMLGSVYAAHGTIVDFDLENLKRWPDVLEDGEPVEFTEKVHGIQTVLADVPGFGQHDALRGTVLISSKGLAETGLAFKWNEENADNAYVAAFRSLTDAAGQDVFQRLRAAAVADQTARFGIDPGTPVHLFAETFGRGVQDLAYGQEGRQTRLFAVYVGPRHAGRFLDPEERDELARIIGIETVPVLYRGPWSREVADLHCSGRESVSGKEACIREGIVIVPAKGRDHPQLGRIALKHVSEAYLLRKGGTEYR